MCPGLNVATQMSGAPVSGLEPAWEDFTPPLISFCYRALERLPGVVVVGCCGAQRGWRKK